MASGSNPLGSRGTAMVIAFFGGWAAAISLMDLNSRFFDIIGSMACVAFAVCPFMVFSKEWRALLKEPRKIKASPSGFVPGVCLALLELLVTPFHAVRSWPSSAPLLLSAEVDRGNYAQGTLIGDIKWYPSSYAELKITIKNPSSYDYSRVEVLVHSELPLMTMTQADGADEDCPIQPDTDLSKITHVGNDILWASPLVSLIGANGQSYDVPFGDNSPLPNHGLMYLGGDVRINCNGLQNNGALSFVAAVINPGQNSSPRPPRWVNIEERHESDGSKYGSNFDLVCPKKGNCKTLSGWRRLYNRLGGAVASYVTSN